MSAAEPIDADVVAAIIADERARSKEFRHYDVRTRHTNVDFADAVDVEDLRQSAIVMAVVAWHAAARDEPIPRLPAAQSP